MTLEEYIRNPMNSSVMTNRQMYATMYTEKWNNIRLRENGVIIYTLYNTNEEYFVHFKIPSEVVPKFYYDVIIRFFLTKNNKEEEKSRMLSNYNVQFFSNDPSFSYTFAHAFSRNNLFIKDLSERMMEKCLKEKAILKNPKDEVGYVKALYFAYLEIKDQGLLLKQRWKNIAKPYDNKIWKTAIRHAFDVAEERQRLGAEIEAQQRREKKREERHKQPPKTPTLTPFESPNIKDFGHFKSTDKPAIKPNKTDYNTIAKSKPGKKGFGNWLNMLRKKK